MPNVDKELHNPEVTRGNLIKERTTSKPKRALRGAAGGSHIGPVLSTAARADSLDGSSYVTSTTVHATGIAAGGVKSSTGHRKSAAWGRGTLTDSTTRTVRPNPGNQTTRGVYRANGVFGGSIPGRPSQRSTQRATVYTTGGNLTAEGAAPVFLDKRSNIYGDGSDALGSAGRGTREVNGAVDTVLSFSSKSGGLGVTTKVYPRMSARPVIQEGANPAAGTVSVGDGTGLVTGDLHADDITGGANGLAGMVVYIFSRDTDTDEDAALIAKGDVDSVTEATITGTSGIAVGTHSCYAAFKDAAGNIGPWSARGTVVVS